MPDNFTGGANGAAWADLVEAAFDRAVLYFLRDDPQWRQVIDYRPVQQAMPGKTVTETIHQPFPTLSTTPLTEDVDVDATAAATPDRVTVSLEEFGFATIRTFYLDELSFTNPAQEIAELLGRHMYDSCDAIVRAVADTNDQTLSKNTGTLTLGGNVDNVHIADKMDRDIATVAVKILRRNKVMPKAGSAYLALIHPDVSYDLQAQDSTTAWIAPHIYGGDPTPVYTGNVGGFQGAQYIETTRCTIDPNSVPLNVYNTYYLGREALIEASEWDPAIVVGPQTDHLRRFATLGWKALFGHALLRPEALVVAQTSSSLGALFA